MQKIDLKSIFLKGLFVAIISILFSACASLSGKTQIHGVDSIPRGLEIADSNLNLIGNTPLFVESKRNTERVFYTREGVNDSWTKTEMTCSYRWVLSGLLNFPVLGQIIDLASGAAWACPDFIMLKNKQISSGIKLPKCKRIAITVPLLSDVEERKFVLLKLRNLAKKDSCDVILPDEKVHWIAQTLGLDDEKEIRNWDTRRKLQFGKLTQATHAIILNFAPTNSASRNATFKGNLVDLIGEEVEDRSISVTLPLLSTQGEAMSQWRRFAKLENILYFLPNSPVFSSGIAGTLWTDTTGQQTLTSYPVFDFGVALKRPYRREKFAPWDFSLDLKPDFFFTSKVERIRGIKVNIDKTSSPIQEQTYRARITSLGIFYGFQLSLHTPLLTPYFSLSYGPYVTWMNFDGSKLTTVKGTSRMVVGLSQFLNDNYYGILEFHRTYSDLRIKNYIFSGFSRLLIGVGYYFDQLPFTNFGSD